MNEHPLVSIIIPVFNDRDGLIRALENVRAESRDIPTEIIVVDDGSKPPITLTDETITLTRLAVNQGAAAARNQGMAQARGRYIAFLDSDDLWGPGKLAEQIRLLDAAADDVAGVFSPFSYLGHEDRVYNAALAPNDWFTYFLMGCRIAPGSSFLMRRAVFEAIGPQDAHLRQFEDWDWLLRMARDYRFLLAPSHRAYLSPSIRTNYVRTEACLDRMAERWLLDLTPPHRRRLQAAIAIERAAMALRQAHYATCFILLAKAGLLDIKTLIFNIKWKYFG